MNLIQYLENRDFFSFAFKVLTFIGVNPARQTRLATAISMVHYLCFVLIFLILEIYYLVLHVGDNVEFVKTVGTAFYHIVGIMRTVHTFCNIHNYYNIWKMLNRSSFDFEKIGFEKLHRGNCGINLKIKHIQQSTIKKANLMCFGLCVILLMGALASIFFSWGRVLFGTMELYVNDKTGIVEVVNKSPYNYYTILDIRKPIMYKVYVFYSSYAIFFLTMAFLCKSKRSYLKRYITLLNVLGLYSLHL